MSYQQRTDNALRAKRDALVAQLQAGIDRSIIIMGIENQNAPEGNVPGADHYDPTAEQDVAQQDTTTPAHDATGQTDAAGEEHREPASLEGDDATRELVASGPNTVPYEIASLVVTADINPTEHVIVTESFATEFDLPAGLIPYGELEALLASKGTQLVSQAQPPKTSQDATVAGVAGGGESGEVTEADLEGVPADVVSEEQDKGASA